MNFGNTKTKKEFKYPGVRAAMDGNTAVIMCERESSDAAGAYPITPSTQMGEYWAEAAANGHINISQRPLIFIEPEGEHAAAAVTAGLSMTGLRSANFSSGQGIAYMHESLYAAVGKRLTYVLNIGARAITKATLNVHAGHDDYHCVDDTGFFQLFAKNAQAAADLNIIAHRISELALNPGIVAQDGFLTTHLIESLKLPERELIAEYLGRPDDIISCPTAAQQMIYGETRRRIPELWDVDNPVMAGIVQNQDSYMQSVAAQRPFFFDHIEPLSEKSFKEFYELTGRQYARLMTYKADDADYLIMGQGSVIPSAEVVADYLRETRKLKVGVVNLLMFRPFPGDLVGQVLKGKKGAVVLERLDQPLASDLPLMREIRSSISKCVENGLDQNRMAYPSLPSYKSSDIPALYSGSFGLGSRDLQAEGLIAAVENMLPEGTHKKLFYLGIDFIRDVAATPKQELHQQQISDAYPHVADLAIHGSENPNLMPPDSITVRFHSIGGWGAITTGKNLAMTLFDLLGYHIKANPKYGSEKKGQPTTYYLSAAPEPIKMNCEYYYVDVVLSPDPNVFNHTNALAGLRKGGVFIIQSELESPKEVWEHIPANYQKMIVENEIKLFYLDAFKIAREEATDSDLQLRMQGNAFQGAFFAASPVAQKANLSEEKLLSVIRDQLQHKFGSKGARVVEDNVRVVQRGYDELREIVDKTISDNKALGVAITAEPALPVMLKRLPANQAPATDIHRFWEQTGSFYARGKGNDNLTDPFISLGVMPAASALYRDMTGIRSHHPEWIPENCTACGKCYTVCPDTSIPGLVNEPIQILDTVVQRVKKNGSIKHLPKAVRLMESNLRPLLANADEADTVSDLIDQAIEKTISNATDKDFDKAELKNEFQTFREALNGFQLALTRPHYTLPEKNLPGSGGLFILAINPYTCKGCGECIEVCPEDALIEVPQTKETIAGLRKNWDLWLDLPSTPQKYIQADDFEEGIGVLESVLLNKDIYLSFTSGDGACMGCSEKTVIHLFVATVEALMQPRIKKHLSHLDNLIKRLEQHIELKLVEEINIDNTEVISNIINNLDEHDITLSRIASEVESRQGTQPIDPVWLKRVTQLVARLKQLKWKYTHGTSGQGRSRMGIINATGCSSVWGSTYPYNPYPFPWANHLFQDSTSMALGVFEGHMAKMAEGFKAVRLAELELEGNYNAAEHDTFFNYFNWHQFSDEEFYLCPPVVAVGGDGAMYDIGFQNLSRAMMTAKPIKVVVLDTQVYSNTGGQACTSGFAGQISDMAPFGKVSAGKQEIRKEIGLIAMAHRTTYVMQSTIAYPNHMIEGFIEGLLSKRPAVFNCYTSCQPEHGIGDDMGHHQAKLAVESRAYPLFRYNPDKGITPSECFDLDGNPAVHKPWPVYKLRYKENKREKTMELPQTFADFAMTEIRFRKHFRVAPHDTWHEDMIPLAEFLELNEDDQQGKFPFIWTVNSKQQLSRLLVDQSIVDSCKDRQNFWLILKELAQIELPAASTPDLADKIRQDVISHIAADLAQLAGNKGQPASTPTTPDTGGSQATPKPAGNYMAPWLDTQDCTACDECTNINPEMFAYNENGKAYIQDPDAGTYQELVRAAERCTAKVIHPGLPANPDAKDMAKWIKRGEKFN